MRCLQPFAFSRARALIAMISFCPHLVFFLLVSSSVAASNTVTASPTNDTDALTHQFGSLRFFLGAATNSSVLEVNLAPLTSGLATLDYSSFQRFSIQGTLDQVTPSNTASITSHNIALISCDPSAYTGYLHVAETVSDVVSLSSGGPAAVILYSQQSNHCNYTVNDPTVSYTDVFTVVNSTASQLFLSQLSSINTTATADINADMSTSSSASMGNSTTTSTGGTISGSTTAVAMIILYTITGIITALFLGIIITGAIRAHRHPERYGPRNVTGRPRQSRARGIARAMLETIPIVKFGDDKEDGVDAAKRDLEMASSTHTAESHDATPESSPLHEADSQPEADHHDHVADATPAATTAAAAAAATTPAAADAGNNNCPICTDDFVKGQDVRLLPCGHQFHPDCIDPWLINVSGTCPLCRIDLNPAASTETGEDGEAAHQEGEATPQTVDTVEPVQNQTNSNRHSRGLAGYLSDIRRARNAPVEERLEALRRLRESQRQRNGDEPATGEETQGRRRYLAMRLRDRFRIRTRQHGSEQPSP